MLWVHVVMIKYKYNQGEQQTYRETEAWDLVLKEDANTKIRMWQ